MQYEVEQKFRLDEPAESIAARLLEFGATAIGEVRQADHYFNHPVRDFATTDEALRIRSVGDQNWLKRRLAARLNRRLAMALRPRKRSAKC